jgi:hypothetical protein
VPTTPAFRTVNGTIRAAGAGTITVAASDGTTTVVQLAPTTRVTKTVSEAASALTAGTAVQVMTDAAATTAQRIVVVPAGQGGFGGRGGIAGQRTPVAGRNPACFRGRGQGAGAGTGATFRGLRGTVESASADQLVVDDAQGQTLTLAITPATLIQTTAAGTTADLTVGATVTVAGTPSGDGGIIARTIAVQPATKQ